MKRPLLVGLLVACAIAIAACGSGGGRADTATTAPAPQSIDAPVPVSLPPAARERFVAGRDVAMRSGCLACHRIGATGNDAIGSNLTGVGERRTPAQLRRALAHSQAPTPSYAALPAGERDALVAFLAALRSPDCPDASDCG